MFREKYLLSGVLTSYLSIILIKMIHDIKLLVSPIKTTRQGFEQIAHLSSQLSQQEFSTITLDMKEMSWCDGNMCAPLGAVLYRASRYLNNIELENIPSSVEALLCKNNFLTSYGRARRTDTYPGSFSRHSG